MKYIVNLDWVELHCEFDSLLYRNQFGTPSRDEIHPFSIFLKPYGTRVYKYVALIRWNRLDFATICWQPLSSKAEGGIMNPNMCHIKLENYWCYRNDWKHVLEHALRVFRIKPRRLSRLDICCDVQNFACGIAGADLCRGLVNRKYYKIHQPNWAAHGQDSKHLSWNSLSFGSKNSPVFTRFYNKTLELDQQKDKQYIRECWKDAGFNMERDVWRIEFALTDTGRDVVDSETGEVFDIKIDQIEEPRSVEDLFLYYAQHYFDIRKNTGAPRYKCPPLNLLPKVGRVFIPYQRPHLGTSTRTDKLVVKRMQEAMFDCKERNERFVLWHAIRLYQERKRIEVISLPEAEKDRQKIYYMGDSEDEEKTLRILYPIDTETGLYLRHD